MIRLRGFTLLELMIVISIAAILLTLAVPSFRSVMLTSERGEASTSLYGGLVRAHSEAIVRNATITICPRLTTASGSFPRCDLNAASWTHGWIVYQDSNGTIGSSEPDVPSDIIAVGDPTDNAFAISTNPSSTTYLQFAASGRAAFTNFGTLTMTLCKSGDPFYEGRVITVDINGRVSLTTFASAPLTPCPSA